MPGIQHAQHLRDGLEAYLRLLKLITRDVRLCIAIAKEHILQGEHRAERSLAILTRHKEQSLGNEAHTALLVEAVDTSKLEHLTRGTLGVFAPLARRHGQTLEEDHQPRHPRWLEGVPSQQLEEPRTGQLLVHIVPLAIQQVSKVLPQPVLALTA